MKTKGIMKGILFMMLLVLLGAPCSASAATYTWKAAKNGNMRCYRNGTELVKDEWVGDKHLNKSGYMDRNTWVKKEVNGKSLCVFVRDDGKWVKNFKGGWQKINKKYYFYTEHGKLVTGWIKSGGKMYYIDKSTKTRVTKLKKISGKLYYFNAKGVLQTNKTITYKGKKYKANGRGVLTSANSYGADMLFFLTFESGSEAYNQTGGDRGNACGAYQFDNRYSLLPFVKYAYKKNPTLCKEFKTYAKYTDGTKLKSNSKFYKAWHKIYSRNRKRFAKLQDDFARQEYYTPVERSLASSGIDLASRPDVVKGAVYSYSIQHGQSAAVNAVKACGIKKKTTNRQFLTKLYNYRMRQHSMYKSRYTSELKLALSKL